MANNETKIIASEEKFSIEGITPDDIPLVVAFLRSFFYRDSPLSECLKMTDDDCLEERQCVKSIPEGNSFKAVNENGEIIGVLLNRYIYKSGQENKNLEAITKCKSETLKIILDYIHFIESNVNIFECYPDQQRILYLDIMSVDPKYRCLGIGRKLINRSLEFMKENHISICQILCTNYFLCALCEKLGFDELFKLDFSDYKVDGKSPLMPSAPHTFGKIFAKRI